MGRKKFIDKKKAHHFKLMHRSRQDPLYHVPESEGGSKFVLEPADEKTYMAMAEGRSNLLEVIEAHEAKQEQTFEKKLDEVDELGFPIDGYDYHQHLAEMSNQGVFVSRSGEVVKSGLDETIKQSGVLASADDKLEAILQNVVVDGDHFDEDVKKLLDEELFGDGAKTESLKGEELFDKLNPDPEKLLDDDFVQKLVEKEKQEPDAEFDFESHMKKLMEEADCEEEVEIDEICDVQEKSELDEIFENFMEEEYNSEQEEEHIEELYKGVDAIDLNTDSKQLDQILDIDNLQMKLAEKGLAGPKSTVLQQNTFKQAKRRVKDVALEAVQREEGKEEENLDEMDVLSVVKSFAAPCYKFRDPNARVHDCQTILSTYSTTSNLPSVISMNRRRKEKVKAINALIEAEEEVVNIPEVIIEKREKGESKEEKKARKQRVKELKKLRREEKKMKKVMFKEEKRNHVYQKIKRKEAAVPPDGKKTS
eukprot:maker-scaffold_28-snap-gene-0.32-mRNA-1 protein AED:0.64 eAED:0.64 QI:0/1/0.5/1/0/0/2/897/478